MRTETPHTVRLAEYRPYAFEIEKTALTFRLDPKRTEVEARLTIRPLADGAMRLDGQQLRLKSIRLGAGGASRETLDAAEYLLDEDGLTLLHPPGEPFTLETVVEIAPDANTALSGLYISGGRFCTQCEAEGFRRITFFPDRPDVMSRFNVRIEADRTACPILLSNGTPGEAGTLANNRHFAVWDDPHKKPAYLFALCAGDYDVMEDSFVTRSGETVGLGIYVEKGEAPRAAWAMNCLKRAMRWDEEVYGREYDLGVFNIVAVRDFNFGAMENKGLNIFNSAYVLADEATATDADFEAIESIVAHEYFHNWTGNRITCRDWFQLCLKEGLTVFRDQNFSADMRSRPVQRIKDVIRLRARQFAEDAGPLAHPVRPDTYGAIDNLYTATVYEKGAELIGMLRRLIGEDAYRRGMDLYFDRHDGEAVTIEDFYACFAEVTGQDFTAFSRWYAQPGTPEVRVTESWEAGEGRLRLAFEQSVPTHPGNLPVPVPLLVALLDGMGGHLAAKGREAAPFLYTLAAASGTLTLDLGPGAARPLVSLNRDFSAPVRIVRSMPAEDGLALARAETDPFNAWDGFQRLVRDELLRLARSPGAAPSAPLAEALAGAVRGALADPAFAALLARLPDVSEMLVEAQPADCAALAAARLSLQAALASALGAEIREILSRPSPQPYDPGAAQASQRALRTAFLSLLAAEHSAAANRLLTGAYAAAPNMTERLAALRALCVQRTAGWDDALMDFEASWRGNPLVMDKWFSVQAATGSAADIAGLVAHPDFDLRNPNRVRAVIAVFAMQNLAAFHAADGSGYRAVEPVILAADKVNPALSARLLTGFESWRLLEPRASREAEATLRRLFAEGLSANAADIVMRSLGEAAPQPEKG